MAVSHVKSLTMADFTGTVTGFNSAGVTQTLAATNLIRPSDWDSSHNRFVTLSGNTSGVSTMSGTNIVLAGGNNITLSAATAAGAATITISQSGAAVLSRFTEFGADGNSVSSVTAGSAEASLRVFYVPSAISFTEVDIPIFVGLSSAATTNTAAVAITSAFVIYTNNASSLSPIAGTTAQTTYSWASNSANFSNLTGGRYFTFPVATVLSPGEYFAAFFFTSNTTSIGASTTSFANQFLVSMSIQEATQTASNWQDFGAATNASTHSYFAGVFSDSISATNQTLAMATCTVTGTANYRANVPFIFLNY